MVRLVDFALNYLACNINSNAANFIFRSLTAFLRSCAISASAAARRAAASARASPTISSSRFWGAGGCLTQKRIAFIPDALQVLLIFLFQLGSLLFGCIRIGVHGINFRLAVVDHLLTGLNRNFLSTAKVIIILQKVNSAVHGSMPTKLSKPVTSHSSFPFRLSYPSEDEQ